MFPPCFSPKAHRQHSHLSPATAGAARRRRAAQATVDAATAANEKLGVSARRRCANWRPRAEASHPRGAPRGARRHPQRRRHRSAQAPARSQAAPRTQRTRIGGRRAARTQPVVWWLGGALDLARVGRAGTPCRTAAGASIRAAAACPIELPQCLAMVATPTTMGAPLPTTTTRLSSRTPPLERRRRYKRWAQLDTVRHRHVGVRHLAARQPAPGTSMRSLNS